MTIALEFILSSDAVKGLGMTWCRICMVLGPLLKLEIYLVIEIDLISSIEKACVIKLITELSV